MEKVIEVKNLVKRYGSLSAVDGISFEVEKGEIYGLLGENGAGKTTTLEIIEGLRKPTSGNVSVLGHSVQRDLPSIKQKIGVQLQSSAYYQYLTLKEMLHLFAGFYGTSVDADRLLEMVDLTAKSSSYVGQLSGGQQQRFSIVASLVNDPEIVFLDEPTTGLDPLARRNLWELIATIKSQGKTIMLTTHYMEEAELLCDRISIMDKGKIVATGKTHQLVEGTAYPYKLTFVTSLDHTRVADDISAYGRIQELGGKSGHYEAVFKTQKDLNTALDTVRGTLEPESLTVTKASLEDVFVELTGKTLED